MDTRTPERTADFSSAAPAASLPVQLTRFIGRARELADLDRLLCDTRLLTLTGAGGSGKTRLAREAAERVAPEFERVLWIDFASLTDPSPDHSLVAQQVALALGVHERPGAIIDVILGAVRDVRLLLVLDNCEHLVDPCADLVTALLTSCQTLTVLATSREALGVPSETAWLVPALASVEATQLFVERAQAVHPAFTLTATNEGPVSEICRRLDGIPLAIELAAARVRVLTPDQIADRLNDAFRLLSAGSRTALPRHRTLRGTMEWSYALLNAREQLLLRRLSVFAGSFSLEAVETVGAGGPLEEEEILDYLSALVDKSLVMMDSAEGEARYRLLETVRQYGNERLRESGEAAALRERHAAFYLDFAETAEPHLFAGAGDDEWLGKVASESDNLRATAEWAAERPERTEVALRLAAALHWYWFARGQFRAGRQQLAEALARSGKASPLARARALIALGHFALWQGDRFAVRPPMQESLDLLRELDDPASLAYALNGVGAALVLEGDAQSCEPYFVEGLEILSRIPATALHSLIRYWRGQAAQQRGDIELARKSFEEAERVGRHLGHRPAIAHPLTMQGRLSLSRRDYRAAFESLTESLAIHQETDDGYGIVQCLEGLSAVAAHVGRDDTGTRLAAAAESLREHLLIQLAPSELEEREQRLATSRVTLGSDFAAAWEAGEAMSKDEAIRLALADVAPHTHEYRVLAALNPPTAKPATATNGTAAGVGTTGVTGAGSSPALRVLALGPLQVFRDGEAIDAASWGSARPRELLLFLLMHPGGCTKEQVGVAFWPEASSAQLRNSFHVTLHRLRKALAHPEWVTLVSDRYQLDPSVACELDASLFEKDVVAAMRALKRGGDDEAATTLERALERYRGDFLDGEPAGDWHLEHRDHLQRLYLDGMLALGDHLLENERYAKSAEAFRRVLARDELHEEAWRQLMLCHARMGERSQALRLYQRLAELLRRELEAEPDSETTKLYQSLQRGVTP